MRAGAASCRTCDPRNASDDSRTDDRPFRSRRITNRQVISLRPLDEEAIARFLDEFPGLVVGGRGVYLIAPRHGREEGERREAFAARMPAQTGCLVAYRRNGRIVERGGAATLPV
jgi:hypothetical protein